ncbi:hypothetical protein A1Q2_08398 [Trichosporon asahii var. asahii CBS 8904]|uniref:Uncharacterized protein n=2 Tax=Trichosporon asahii var. asahii TaxID=189963 RepID=K1W6B4_TRIAC|nr:hypothetical protein A1Q1_01196 [Trichosporon asahii var. asahii CBS 2479]EJT49698.1 hypothetical protein A1Q1_01196 [Trichosporon asahii var. asahii CBS 2479]EKC97318.1 hypothetical protein A1Q2_08398 [Trichosporon asahii var. asahii CBS 8904]
MIFTCSFPKNNTVEAECCKYGPKPEQLSSFTLKQDQATYCAVDKLDYLIGCLADHSITVDECRVDGINTATAAKKSYASASSPPTRLGMLCLTLLGLSLLAGVSAAPASNSTVCKTFKVNSESKSDWDVNARTSLSPLYQGAADCRGSSRCSLKADDEMRPTWKAEWFAPPGVEVHADFKAIVSKANELDHKVYGEAVEFPKVPEHEQWAVPPGAVVNVKGQASATRIPGTFSDCDNEQAYPGSVLLPRADQFWYKAVQGPA